ncbi:MAG: histidinol phosphatase [Microbacterium sp.]|uniref:inositol monophosphatase family protein n=1 Tax=Microbacterium sp. TaxID=51671 RepID=UPI001AD3FB21|nr:inositol monophosphatase family protein [Microbacterium sp.]MBN9152998.1 histidinol phosphatase [Microbacterium sp.]MBN9171268.1 histidinol phosphatase [Microbacterium sp.]MBN9174858.1 histidinol phosphatase [Microbacterium sp.]MBN9183049.1 histidinol phosphatase [Microbacterium sp.]
MTPAPSPTASSTPADDDLTGDLALALRLADAADAASMSRFDAPDLDVSTKADATHVTEADLATERAMRAILSSERPGDGVFGEEFGRSGSSSRQWILDPIDGTANYLKGIPMWATLIALAVDGVPRVGVVSQPAIGRRWWAATGHGAWTSEAGATRRIRVSGVDEVARASASFQSIAQWDESGHLDALLRLSRAVWRDRGYGDAWPYMLLAEGRLEFVAEFGVKEYDIASHVPIIAEAGGRLTSFDGDDAIDTLSALATNGVLHDDFLRLLHPPQDVS